MGCAGQAVERTGTAGPCGCCYSRPAARSLQVVRVEGPSRGAPGSDCKDEQRLMPGSLGKLLVQKPKSSSQTGFLQKSRGRAHPSPGVQPCPQARPHCQALLSPRGPLCWLDLSWQTRSKTNRGRTSQEEPQRTLLAKEGSGLFAATGTETGPGDRSSAGRGG